MKSIIVSEKPSVAADLAKALKVSTKNCGGYFENDNYIITWALGHLLGLGYPQHQNPAWEGYSMEHLPMFPNFRDLPLDATKKQLNVICDLVKRTDVKEIINAGDAGIEGEGIQWEIYNYAFMKAKKRLPVKRLWLNSFTEKAILKGMDNLEPDGSRKTLFQAFLARRNSDWLYGMNLSRFFGMTYNVKGLAVGRVMTAVIGMVVEREREIANFKSEPYYQIAAEIDSSFKAMWFDKEENKAVAERNKETATNVYNSILGKSGTVTVYKTEEKKTNPSPLLNLAEIQKQAIKLYGITSDETLAILQVLYSDKKITTYPRTDSHYLTSDDAADVPGLIQAIANSPLTIKINPALSQAASSLLENGLNVKNIVNDSKVNDHTGLAITENFETYNEDLSKKEIQILNLILSRLVVSLSDTYIYNKTTIELNIENQTFATSGNTPISMGWKDVQKLLLGEVDEEKEDVATLPILSEGSSVTVTNAELLNKKTTPPAHFNESSLLDAMEKVGKYIEDPELKKVIKESDGIGTPATRAEIISKLLKKEYLTKDTSKSKKNPNIIPSQTGYDIYDILPRDMTSPTKSAVWQQQLNAIEDGTITYETYIKGIQSYICGVINNYEHQETNLEKVDNTPSEKQLNFAKNIALTLNIELPAEITKASIKEFIDANMESFNNAGEKKYAQQADFILGKCPLCDGNIYQAKSGNNYYCSNYKSGCKFNVMKSDYGFKNITGKEITKIAIKNLLEKGSTKAGGKTITVTWNTSTSPKGFMVHTFKEK